MSCGVGCRRSLDLMLLWLWYRLEAIAPIGPLAWEPPYAMSVALKPYKSKKKKKKEFSAHISSNIFPGLFSLFSFWDSHNVFDGHPFALTTLIFFILNSVPWQWFLPPCLPAHWFILLLHLFFFSINEFYCVHSCTTIITTKFYSISTTNPQCILPPPNLSHLETVSFSKVCESVSVLQRSSLRPFF